MCWLPTVSCVVITLVASPGGEHYPFSFRDVSREAGLLPHLSGLRGHAAAWGDADGDGWLDLYVGTFYEQGSGANVFLWNREGRFELDTQQVLRATGCASGAVFADLDADGDLDLYLSNLAKTRGTPGTGTPNRLFRNDGGRRFADVSEGSGASPAGFKGRSVAAFDFDGDGLLDLLAGEDHSYGSERRSRLFRNAGGLKFEDATLTAGLPGTLSGLGVAAGDLDGDGWPEVVLAGREATNVIFLNEHGRFRELPGSRELLAWKYATPDDAACGVAFGDVDLDGDLDLVVGQHTKRPWVEPVAVRLFLNRGAQGGEPALEEVTEAAGLVPLPMKAPHVEVRDFDGDGWPDIYASIVKFAGDQVYPLIYRNLGVKGGLRGRALGELPRFFEDALAANDFPTAEDRATADTGRFFQKMLRERKIEYMAPAPAADYDNDGRMDLLLVSWWIERGSLLLRNETAAGNWLRVEVRGGAGVNPQGIGARVRLYRPGRLGDPAALLGSQEVACGYGYASGQAAAAHFGLGKLDLCDVEVVFPHGKGKAVDKGVNANRRVTVERGR